MKIAFVFPPTWSLETQGSLQIWNREVTSRLSNTCDVMIYSSRSDEPADESVDGIRYRRFFTDIDRWLRHRFNAIHKALGRKGPIVYSDFWYLGYAINVALDIRKQGCDVAHVYYFPQFASLIKRLNPGVRVVLHMHGEWLTQVKFPNLAAKLARLDAVLTCSDFITASTSSMFPRIAGRCSTLPMGISADAFARPRHENGASGCVSRRLLCVARISPEKGIHVLLDAFELIVRQFPDATLTVVGPEWIASRDEGINLYLDKETAASLAPFYEGSYLAQLKQKLSQQAASRITFAGLVAYEDIPAYYANADIYVSPSLYESFGMSVIEAMAAGLPVVAGRTRSFEDLILDGSTGLLVPASDPAAVAAAVGRLFTNPELGNAISHKARESVRVQFSWETICSSLLRTYRALLGAKSSAAAEYAECKTAEPAVAPRRTNA